MGTTKPYPFTQSELQIALRSRALAHPIRVKILELLRDESYTNIDLARTLNMSTSSIKEHLDKLMDAGLLSTSYFPNGNKLTINRRQLEILDRLMVIE